MKKEAERAMKTASNPVDPIVAAEVKRALAPYEGIHPPDVLATMAEILEHALTTHPVGTALVDRVRPRVSPSQSATVAKDEESAASAPAKKAGAK